METVTKIKKIAAITKAMHPKDLIWIAEKESYRFEGSLR